jgi:fluoride ion exporter CrcB/FEX
VSGAAGALVANQLSNGDRIWTFTGAVGGSLLAGLVKETIDQNKSNNSWDNGDLAATVLGGVTVGVTIDLFSGKKRKKKKQVTIAIL